MVVVGTARNVSLIPLRITLPFVSTLLTLFQSLFVDVEYRTYSLQRSIPIGETPLCSIDIN
jgi:hypothetical protein